MHWRKSSYSGEDAEHNCVELGRAPGAILLRESDDPGVVIATTPAALRGLVARIKTGGFDHMAG
ncbi:DUF397 domain-containing protein [Streptomyces sp. GMR22]|uniref:DUF397 domain-containing protein n=1 Tax=Streptomyces sp. GMR22 TaxID=2759524 RepID=UPI0015FC9640|nr:DUF397 domain-containing protein [Streptomyces sp. GMR22]MBA6437311.1 DUF397 domain-containing protein [Streptomyces sp. GMR22]